MACVFYEMFAVYSMMLVWIFALLSSAEGTTNEKSVSHLLRSIVQRDSKETQSLGNSNFPEDWKEQVIRRWLEDGEAAIDSLVAEAMRWGVVANGRLLEYVRRLKSVRKIPKEAYSALLFGHWPVSLISLETCEVWRTFVVAKGEIPLCKPDGYCEMTTVQFQTFLSAELGLAVETS